MSRIGGLRKVDNLIQSWQVLGQQAPPVPDVSNVHDPSHHVISELAFSTIPTQEEVQALQAQVLRLRDFVADMKVTVNMILQRLRSHGLIAEKTHDNV